VKADGMSPSDIIPKDESLPVPGPSGEIRLNLPSPNERELQSGVPIWVVEKHTVPLAAISMTLHAGAEWDSNGRPGVATLAGELLDAGTGEKSLLEIARRVESIGATLGVSTSFDGMIISIVTHSRFVPDALEILADVVLRPVFPAEEFERVRSRREAVLMQQKDRPGSVATQVFHRVLYGAGHPYGNDPLGTPESIRAIERAEVTDFWQKRFAPDRAALLAVGDTDGDDFASVARGLFSDWTPSSSPLGPAMRHPGTPKRAIYLVDRAGSAQSEIRIGRPALQRKHPAFFSALVVNKILGGQFSSRLNMNLREKKGLTYGAHSHFSFNKQPGPFVASGAVETTKTALAVQEFLREIDLMAREGVTEEELEVSKKGIAGNFVLNFETPLQVAYALQNCYLYELPRDYFATYVQNIGGVTRGDAARLAAEYLEPSTMAIVVVGDAAKIRSDLDRLGEVIPCDPEGVPIV